MNGAVQGQQRGALLRHGVAPIAHNTVRDALLGPLHTGGLVIVGEVRSVMPVRVGGFP